VRIRPWLSVAFALLAAGGALTRPLPAQAPDDYPAGASGARIDGPPMPGGAVRFTLARPAYVALFAVIPGEAVRLLYPADPSQRIRRFAAGSHTRATRRGFDDRPRLATMSGTPPGARYLYLVTSSRPLRLDAALGWGGGELRSAAPVQGRWLDPRAYDVDATLEGLFDLVVPDLDGADVATDLLEYYPDVRFRRDGRVYALSALRCYDGALVYAPAGDSHDPALADWYGVDFYRGRYVDASCLQRYFQPGLATGPGTVTPPERPGSRRTLRPNAVAPNDVRPSIPLAPGAVRPTPPGGAATPIAGRERMDAAAESRRPSPHRPLRLPESQAEPPRVPAPEPPRIAVPREVRPAPVSRPEPPPARAEPARMEPARAEPAAGAVRERVGSGGEREPRA
jgi:hypothetical protein